MSKKILLVGHCSPDSSYLSIVVRSACPQATVQRINDDHSLQSHLKTGCDLLLVNRLLDGRFADFSGVDIVARCHALRPDIPVMLVSDYPEAQAHAIAAGARPGFGKSELQQPRTRHALLSVLGDGCQPKAVTP